MMKKEDLSNNISIFTFITTILKPPFIFHKIIFLWFLVTNIFLTVAIIVYFPCEAARTEVKKEFYHVYHSRYQNQPPRSPQKAFNKAINSTIYYSTKKDSIMKEDNIDGLAEMVLDKYSRQENFLSKILYFTGLPAAISVILSAIFFFGYITFKIINKLRQNQFRKSVFKFDGILLLLLVFNLALCSFFYGDKNDRDYSIVWEIHDYSFKTYGGLIKLSNYMYEIGQSNNQADQLVKIEYLKIKSKELLKELEDLKPINPGKVITFENERVNLPLTQLCKDILEFTDLATSIPHTVFEQQSLNTKSIAKFNSILDTADKYYEDTKGLIGPFDKYLLNLFNDEAILEYKRWSTEPEETKQNIYKIFGYRLFLTITTFLDTDDAQK